MLEVLVSYWWGGGSSHLKWDDVGREWGRPDNCDKIFKWWSGEKGLHLFCFAPKSRTKITWRNLQKGGFGSTYSWLVMKWAPHKEDPKLPGSIWKVKKILADHPSRKLQERFYGKLGDPVIHILIVLVLEFYSWGFLTFRLGEWLGVSCKEITELWELSCSKGWAPSRQTRPQEGQVALSPGLYHSQRRLLQKQTMATLLSGSVREQTGGLYVISYSPHHGPWRLLPRQGSPDEKGPDNLPRTRRNSPMEPVEAAEIPCKRGSGATAELE